ncbi:MAG: helix-turn-helix domain-containing protein [Rhizobiales bacterium]|nr:helix-turn-helix domain-containing protein [Hyphomicrobiales bacterium]
MNFDYLGSFISSFRQANNESLQSLADRSGVSRSMIAQIESGQKNPTIQILAKLADAMSISLEDFVKPPTKFNNSQVLRPSTLNIISKKDSPFICHLLSAKSSSSPADFYQFYFIRHGKTSFAANQSKNVVKYLWLERGNLTVYLASEAIRLYAGQAIMFNASIPHRFENRKAELASGTFTVVHQI